jgi:signal transduction histidine kinase
MAELHEYARMGPDELDIERKVARCRVLLSVFALLSVYLLPNNAALMRWSGFTGAPYHVEPYALLVFGAHLGYSVAVYGSLMIGLVPRGIVAITTWVDIGTGAITAIVTEGPTSPFYAFFAFAVVAAGVRGGFRFAMVSTAVSIWIYFCLIAFSASRTVSTDLTVFIMRPVYLAIIGYLVAYLGRLRLALEAKIAALQRAKERGEIARALHDGCVQTLAGTNLTLGSCQELVRRGRAQEALATLGELQKSITRDYDALRTYIRELAERDATPRPEREFATRFSIKADFGGSGVLIEHVLNIMLEGARNIRRHAFARSAAISAQLEGDEIRITIDDDGLGFAEQSGPPWSIASRVDQLGGAIELGRNRNAGAHLQIALRGA